MTQAHLTTAVRRRFRRLDRFGSGREFADYVYQTSGLKTDIEALEEELMKLALKGVEVEFQFWVRMLRTRCALPENAVHAAIGRAYSLLRQLPEQRRDALSPTLIEQKRRHYCRLARAEYKMICNYSRRRLPVNCDYHRCRRRLLRHLHRGNVTLEDIGVSMEDYRRTWHNAMRRGTVEAIRFTLAAMRISPHTRWWHGFTSREEYWRSFDRMRKQYKLSLRILGTTSKEISNFRAVGDSAENSSQVA